MLQGELCGFLVLLFGRDLGASQKLAIDGIEYLAVADQLTDRLEWIDKAIKNRFFLDIRYMHTFGFFGVSYPHKAAPVSFT